MPLDRYAGRCSASPRRWPGPTSARPTIAGAHLEGPFLGRSPGAHPVELIVPIDLDWLAALPPHVAVVTLGAEQPHAVGGDLHCSPSGAAWCPIGHTQCSEDEFDAAVAAGARLTTHLFNGMSGVHHRAPGVAAFALTNPDVSASLIADGVHVHPRVLRLAAQALGRERMVLVTDAVAWRAGTVGAHRHGVARRRAPAARRHAGRQRASRWIAAIRDVRRRGVPQSSRCCAAASTNPARLLGLHDRGAHRGRHACRPGRPRPRPADRAGVGGRRANSVTDRSVPAVVLLLRRGGERRRDERFELGVVGLLGLVEPLQVGLQGRHVLAAT